MEYPKSKVYVKADSQNRILRVEGGYSMSNIQDISQWAYIDEGYGDKYNLCQNNYLDGGTYTMDSIPRYKLVDGKPVLRTEAEIEADRAARPKPEPSKTLESRVDTLETDSAQTKEALEMILAGVTE